MLLGRTAEQGLASTSGRRCPHCKCLPRRTQSPQLFSARAWQTDSRARHRRPAVDYAVDFTPAQQAQVPRFSTVEDIMTKGRIFTVHEDTSIDEALEILVCNRITGLPVVNDEDVVVGVVSDFDMLSLDAVSGKARYQDSGIFPDTNTDWNTFFEVQKLLTKNQGKTVADVMTHNPMVVRGNTDLEGAARLLLERHIRRMPVVDSEGRLVGVFSRGDVIRAALAQRKAAQQAANPSSGQDSPASSRDAWLRGD